MDPARTDQPACNIKNHRNTAGYTYVAWLNKKKNSNFKTIQALKPNWVTLLHNEMLLIQQLYSLDV